MAISPNDRQRVMRTSRVEEAPNPGPWPQATPVGEVSQPDGSNYSGYNDSGSAPALTIGAITVAGDASPTVGDTETYSASHNGTATDVVYTFSAPGEAFTGGEVTWANAGAATVTATGTSNTASNSPQTGTLAVTVAAAPAPTPLSLTITANGTEAFDGSANLADGARIAAKYTVTPGGVPETPAFQWTVAGDNAADVVKYKMTVIDQEPNSDGNTGLFVHWNIGGSAGGTAPASLFTTSTSIASTDGNSPAVNNWAPTNCVGQVSDGIGGFEDSFTFANGWTSVGGFGTGTHTYQVTVIGYNSSDGEEIRDTFSFTHTE